MHRGKELKFLDSMKKLIKQNKVLYPVYKFVRKGMTFASIKACNTIYKIFRENSPTMEKYKGIHKNERCFIVATGPSLTMQDLELIRDEYTFSMNSIVNIFDETSFRPTYYLLQDGHVEKRLREKIQKLDLYSTCDLFLGLCNYYSDSVSITKKTYKRYYKEANWYNLNYTYHCFNSYYHPDNVKMGFSEDLKIEALDGFTVTYTAIELAVYMGFKEIYLLGCDTTFGGHVGEANSDKHPGKDEPAFFNILAYEEAKRFGDKHGIQIYNATRGGMLEVFPRVDLD